MAATEETPTTPTPKSPRGKKKQLLVVVVAAILVGLAAAAVYWFILRSPVPLTSYQSTDHGFSIDRPTAWEEMPQEQAIIFKEAGADEAANDEISSLVVAVNESDQELSEEDFYSYMEGMVEGAKTDGSEVVSSSREQIDGQPGHFMELKSAETGARVHILGVLKDNKTFYLVLLSVDKDETDLPKVADDIIDSFHLTN